MRQCRSSSSAADGSAARPSQAPSGRHRSRRRADARPVSIPRRLSCTAGASRRSTAGCSASSAPSRTRSAVTAASEARVAPSATLRATPSPRPGRIAAKTPSAPVLIASRPRRLHQLGAGPALAGDEDRVGHHRRDQPLRRRGPRAPEPARAAPSAPSPAQGPRRCSRSSAPSSRRSPSRRSSRRSSPRRLRGRRAAPDDRDRRIRGRPGDGPQGEEARMLARAVVVHLPRRRARAPAAAPARSRSSGTCGAAAQVRLAEPEAGEPPPDPLDMGGAPECDAQARASASSPSPAASAAPLSTSGSAWSILQLDRGRITRAGSPQAATMPPSSATTACPEWTHSTKGPRVTSTRGTAPAANVRLSHRQAPPRCRRRALRAGGGTRAGCAT
jgi:hypothetical protein